MDLPLHAVLDALSRLGEVLDTVDGAASWSLSEGELREAVAGWFAVRSRVDAAWLGVVRDLDARPEAVAAAQAITPDGGAEGGQDRRRTSECRSRRS